VSARRTRAAPVRRKRPHKLTPVGALEPLVTPSASAASRAARDPQRGASAPQPLTRRGDTEQVGAGRGADAQSRVRQRVRECARALARCRGSGVPAGHVLAVAVRRGAGDGDVSRRPVDRGVGRGCKDASPTCTRLLGKRDCLPIGGVSPEAGDDEATATQAGRGSGSYVAVGQGASPPCPERGQARRPPGPS
jgi:hypothetical protein